VRVNFALIAKKDFVKNQDGSVRIGVTLTDREVMKKRILIESRIRSIQGGFAFIPHRFLGDGFVKRLEPCELLLYLFLVIASDAYGLSYYGDRSICRLLKMKAHELERSRQALIEEDLIAFDAPLYQVLELPVKPVTQETGKRSSHSSSLSSFAQFSQSLRD
jgi:hypothetical protein